MIWVRNLLEYKSINVTVRKQYGKIVNISNIWIC